MGGRLRSYVRFHMEIRNIGPGCPFFCKGKRIIWMHWAKHLYLSEKTAAKKDKIIRKARRGAGMVGIYFITLASNEENLFDIFHAAYLKQPAFARQNLYVVGIASGYEEALELVRRMVEDIYRATGGFRVREYFRTED